MPTWTPHPPVDLALWGRRFTRWGDDPCTVVADGAVHREAHGIWWRATQNGDTIELHTDDDPVVAMADLRVRLGDGIPWEPVAELAERDERVARLVARYPGYRIPVTPDPFEAIVTAVTAQQVNLRWALVTRRRLVEAFGTVRHVGGVTVWAFPRPERVADADPAVLRGFQFTTAKARTIVGVARAAVDGYLDPLPTLSNAEATAHLCALKGIGRWTADQVLARCLARPDAVAAGDLGVRKAVSFRWFTGDELLDEATVRDTAETWGDAANWVTHLLLEDLATAGG